MNYFLDIIPLPRSAILPCFLLSLFVINHFLKRKRRNGGSFIDVRIKKVKKNKQSTSPPPIRELTEEEEKIVSLIARKRKQASNNPATKYGEDLLRAAQRNDYDAIYGLITIKGVDPSYKNPIGQTALHVAVLWGNLDCVTILLELNANVNAQNSIMGSTPLHTVLHSPKVPSPDIQERIVDMLLHAGADVNIEDNNRSLPLEYVPSDHPNRTVLRTKLKSTKKRNAGDVLMNDVIGTTSVCRTAAPTLFKKISTS